MTSHGHHESRHHDQGHHGHESHQGHHRHAEDPEHGHSHVDEDMLSVEEAYERIMACFSRLDSVNVPLLDSLGQALASDVYSPLDLPPMTNSAMDGYAVRSEDIQGAGAETPRTLKVIGLVAAGSVSDDTVTPGTSIRIMTGAPIPAGADTVVPFEETDEVRRRQSGDPSRPGANSVGAGPGYQRPSRGGGRP